MKNVPLPSRSPPLRLSHAVRAQQIEVGASEEAGYALVERIGELNRSRWLPAIERIFDEFDRPGEVIRIDRLDLDLGRVEPDALEGLERRLIEALRAALGKALGEAARAGTRPAGAATGGLPIVRSLHSALVEIFEHYLVGGAWPYGVPLVHGTRPADLFSRLLEEGPTALAAMLRRHSGSERVRRRLVAQMPEPLLERLLERLEPESAGWILAYMAETRAAHWAQPIVDESREAFGAMLWLVVLRDALHRAGLRSNRRAFVAKLIEELAAAAGLSADALLSQLQAALSAAPAEARGDGSLLSILAEIGDAREGAAAGAQHGALPGHVRVLARALAALASSEEEAAALMEAALHSPRPISREALVRRLVEVLGRSGASNKAERLEAMRAGPVAAGGEVRRVLAPLLLEAVRRDPPRVEAIARRERAIEALSLLFGPSASARAGAAERLGAMLPVLVRMDREALRSRLEAATVRVRDVEAGVRQLDRRVLLRLIALLSPAGEGREAARARVAGADHGELAALAASLLTGSPIDEAGPPPRRSRFEEAEEEALATARAALAAGNAPGDGARRAFAFLLRRRPLALIRLLGSEALGGHAWGALVNDPVAAAALFAALPEQSRREAEALARRLSGPASRGGLRSLTAARALVRAVRAMLGGHASGEDFAGVWREALLAIASPAERRFLSKWFAAPQAAVGSVSPRDGRPEPGSAAWLVELLGDPSARNRRLLRAALGSPAARRRLIRSLPPHLLVRLLGAAFPDEARVLLAAREIFIAAGHASANVWEATFEAAARSPSGGAVGRLLDRLLPEAAEADQETRLAQSAGRRGGGELAPLAAALRARQATREGAGSPQGRDGADRAGDRPSTDARDGAPIFVTNAGLVLAGAYLPQLFEMLGLIVRDEGGKPAWRGGGAAERAVHLLQYLADGRTDAPEPLLPLNKLLCGLDPSWPVAAAIEMSDKERETCDSLLAAMIGNWPMLSGSSIAALRETFFQREGRLTRSEEGWRLEVERKTLDVLLDSVPWSYGLISHPWMPGPLSVSW